MNIKSLIISVVVLMIIIVLCILALTFFVPEEYRIQYSCQNCSIGKVDFAAWSWIWRGI